MNSSVLKAINLLEELARLKRPVALKVLAGSTNLNKATAFRLLNSLREKGFVQQIGEHRLYGLGPSLLAIAEEYRRSFTMRDRVLPYLEELVHETGETAIYCERFQRDSCVTIERRESPHHTRTVIQTGIPRPLYVGSSAFAILAALPQEEVQAILGMKPLKRFTPFTLTTQKQILKKIEQVKRRGYTVSLQERYSFTAGVAAPCFLGESVIGSVSVIGPTERIKATGIEKIGKIVRRIAEALSAEHGKPSGAFGLAAARKRLRLVK